MLDILLLVSGDPSLSQLESTGFLVMLAAH